MAIFTQQLMAVTAFIENLQSLLINVKGAIFGGTRFIKQDNQVIDLGTEKTGFCIAQDGILKASGAEISGRIEAHEGFFHGELEAGPFKANTQPVMGSLITYSSNTLVRTLMNAEFSRFGMSVGTYPISINKTIKGSFNGQNINNIYIYDQGRAGVGDASYIQLNFSSGENLILMSQSYLTSALSFRYSTSGWTVSLSQILTSDPMIPGVLWRDGNTLKISL